MRVVAAAASFSSLLPVIAGSAVTHTCTAAVVRIVLTTGCSSTTLAHVHGRPEPLRTREPLRAQWQPDRAALRRRPFKCDPQKSRFSTATIIHQLMP